MRKLYENDVKNRITTVTEYSLTRKGVKKESYATEYTNTNLVELSQDVQSAIRNTIADPINTIADSMLDSTFRSNFKPIICTADSVTSDFILTKPTVLEYATLSVQNKYSENTVVTIWEKSGDEPTLLGSIVLDNPDSDSYSIGLNHGVNASSDYPVNISVSIVDNTLEDSSAVLTFVYSYANQ